jgi:hypothetical protein
MSTQNQIECAYCRKIIQAPLNGSRAEHSCPKLRKARGESYFIAAGGGLSWFERFGTEGRDYHEASVEDLS